MGKAPAFQFYPNDWARDLEEHPLEIEGAWIRICCKLWWAEPKGKLSKTLEQWAKILRQPQEEAQRLLEYISDQRIGDVGNAKVTHDNDCSRSNNGLITVISRRMYNDNKDRELNMLRQRRFKEKRKSNALVTGEKRKSNGSSSSSSSSSSSIQKKIYKRKVLSDEEFLASLKEKFTWVNFDEVMIKIDASLMAKPGRKKTRRFIVNWLNRIEKPMEVGHGRTGSNMDPVERLRRAGKIDEERRRALELAGKARDSG